MKWSSLPVKIMIYGMEIIFFEFGIKDKVLKLGLGLGVKVWFLALGNLTFGHVGKN